MADTAAYDAIVVGGGLVGVAIAYGLTRNRLKVVVLDEGDVAVRASRANFGLVWVQGKGGGMPAYARWTRRSSDLWPHFRDSLAQQTGIDLQYSRPGGFHFCLDETELAQRREQMAGLAAVPGSDFRYEMLDRKALQDRFPRLGDAVLGASFCPLDGHVNSLRLLRALHAAVQAFGGAYAPNRPVSAIDHAAGGFTVMAGGERFAAPRVVLAAGHGTRALAPLVGLKAPVGPERGQVLVTARVKPFLDAPTALLRQTGEGSVLIGDSKEETGFDDATTPQVMQALAARAVATFPVLRDVPVVRSWGGLRVMSPDGFPVYQQSASCPGAYVACVHSGVTLAAVHAGPLADAIAAGTLPPDLEPFRAERFDVPQAA